MALSTLVTVLALILVGIVVLSSHGTAVAVPLRAVKHAQTRWAPCNRNARSKAPSTFQPLSDRAAAKLVTPEPETRPDNDKPFTIGGVTYPPANTYVPTQAQINTFRSAKTSFGQTELQFNPYFRFVDGRDGMRSPSTDDLIQWAAHKWGIPENWLRAEYVVESYWSMYQLGDLETVSPDDYKQYPLQSRVPGTLQVYQSLGITQVRWDPERTVSAGTEPVRWESTAFSIDYQAAMVRFYYDNPQGARTEWGDSTYVPCEKWNSIGGWYNPFPWGNPGQAQYVGKVQNDLATTAWRSSAFLAWTPPTLPPGLTLK